MFIETTTAEYTLYKLTKPCGELIHVGIVPFDRLTALNDVPHPLPTDNAWISVIKSDDDRLKLANNGLAWLEEQDRPDLIDRLKEVINTWSAGAHDLFVECIETGETWDSAAQAARAHDLSYSALIKHLNGEKSFNSVKKRTYRRLS